MKFVVYPAGTRVRANCWKEDSGVPYRETEGWVEGVIVSYTGDIVCMCMDNGTLTDRWAETAVSLSPPLDVDTHVKQRCGRRAVIVEKSDDPERPIVAVVQMGDGTERRLSYSQFGYFYKTQPLPIDLVNA